MSGSGFNGDEGGVRVLVIGILALVGTRKGLFLLEGDADRRRWQVEGPLLDGWGVYHATVDRRDGTVYAAANHYVYGPTVQPRRTVGEPGSGRGRSACPRSRG
jgi:hypothetical protein